MKPHKFITTLLLSLMCGCGSSQNTPTINPEPPPIQLTVKTTPDIVMSYVPIRVTCLLPTDVGDGSYVFSINDEENKSVGPIDRRMYYKEIIAPCEPFTIFCAYQENTSNKPVSLTKVITPIGECR